MSRFYADLPVLTEFSAVTQPERFGLFIAAKQFKERAAKLT